MKVISAMYTGHCGLQGKEDFAVTQPSELYDIVAQDPKEQYCLVFHGGTDVHPGWYKQQAHPSNQQYNYDRPIERDLLEVSLFNAAIDLQIPIFGICRGAQLACVMAGGALFQHFNSGKRGSSQNEMLTLYTGDQLVGNSYHHQLMDLSPLKEFEDYHLLAWTEYDKAVFWRGEPESVVGPAKQPEIIWFPKQRCLAVQGHPEWAEGSEFQKFCMDEFYTRIDELTAMAVC